MLSGAELRRAMRKLPTGVTLVTTPMRGGPVGVMTANSVTSVNLCCDRWHGWPQDAAIPSRVMAYVWDCQGCTPLDIVPHLPKMELSRWVYWMGVI
jgi:hypothetical protein